MAFKPASVILPLRRILLKIKDRKCHTQLESKAHFHLCACHENFKTTTVKEKIEARKRWNSENLELYGPLLKNSSKSTNQENSTAGDASVTNVPRKRGRPRKIKPPEVEEIKQNNSTESDSTVPETKASSQPIPPEPIQYVSYIDPSEPDLSSLNNILLFPLFPPHYSEYYISPPQIPTIHIPGQSERSAYEKPFFPSVGTILSTTMPPESRIALKRWRDSMVKKLGEEGFKQHKKDIFARGINFHETVQSFLEGAALSDLQVAPGNDGYWESAQTVLNEISDVRSVENAIIHRDLCYKGQYDCIAQYQNKLVLIDWKTSTKTKSDITYTYDNPLQVAAYVGAHNFTKDQKYLIDQALIVVCYEDGQPAHSHHMTRNMCVHYWDKWLHRLHQYWAAKIQGKQLTNDHN